MKKIIVLAFCIIFVQSFVVKYPEQRCASMCKNCPKTKTQPCRGLFKKDDICGCCNICLLGEGESCVTDILMGFPSREHCRDDLYCNPNTLLCQKLDTVY